MSLGFDSPTFSIVVNPVSENVVCLTAVNKKTGQTYICPKGQLSKINLKTILGAFSKEVEFITYEFQELKDLLVLTIRVSMDFLPPFGQSFELVLSSESASQLVNFVYFKQEIESLEKAIVKLEKQKDIYFTLTFKVSDDSQFKAFWLKLSAGKFLLQASGSAQWEYSQNGYEDEGYDQNAGAFTNFNTFNFWVTSTPESTHQKSSLFRQKISLNKSPDYEYIFCMTKIINITEQSLIQFWAQRCHYNHPLNVKSMEVLIRRVG